MMRKLRISSVYAYLLILAVVAIYYLNQQYNVLNQYM